MKNWTKQIMMVKGFPVKLYVNPTNTQAIVFQSFGRYYRLSSENVLDFATTFLFAKRSNIVSFAAYKMSSEETVLTNIAQVA
jgi:hypothetical protein